MRRLYKNNMGGSGGVGVGGGEADHSKSYTHQLSQREICTGTTLMMEQWWLKLHSTGE